MARGVRERHARSCRSPSGGRCTCEPSYEAQVWDGQAGKPIRRSFADPAEARSWVGDARRAMKRGRTVTKPKDTVETVCDAWLDDAEAGIVRARGGHAYKPAAIRSYRSALRDRVYP